MIPESKDLVNSSSGGDFSRLRVSEAKRIIGRLVDAKKAYDDPRTNMLRMGATNSVVVPGDDKVEARIDKLEKTLLTAIEKNRQPALPEKVSVATGQEEHFQNYGSQGDMDYLAQVNATGSWNLNGNWNSGKQRDAPWRDHPNFRWGKGNQNQPNPHQNTYNGSSSQDAQPNWSGWNQQNPHPPHSNQNSAYVPPHQRGTIRIINPYTTKTILVLTKTTIIIPISPITISPTRILIKPTTKAVRYNILNTRTSLNTQNTLMTFGSRGSFLDLGIEECKKMLERLVINSKSWSSGRESSARVAATTDSDPINLLAQQMMLLNQKVDNIQSGQT